MGAVEAELTATNQLAGVSGDQAPGDERAGGGVRGGAHGRPQAPRPGAPALPHRQVQGV